MAKNRSQKRGATESARGSGAFSGWSWQEIAGAVVIVLAGFACLGPALQGELLVNWDDHALVTDNVNLRTVAGLWNIWIGAPGFDYWPLTYTFFWMEWHLFGDEPFGYHFCSFSLHLISGFLLWRLLAKLGLRWAWLGGLLFVVHPLAVESVAWVSETKNTFSLPFYLLSLIAWLGFEQDRKRDHYLRSLAFYTAALLSKTSGIMLPTVLLLHAWWKRGKITRDDLKNSAPFFLVSILMGLLTIFFQNHQVASDVLKPRPFGTVFLCAGEAIFFYAGKFFFPAGLCLTYPRWTFDPPSFWQLFTWPLLAVVLFMLWNRRATWGRHALFGLGFFLLMLLPVLGFIHMTYMKVSWVADHLVYLPMIGLVGLAAAGLERGHALLPVNLRKGGIGLLAVLMAGLIWASRADSSPFASEELLWTTTLQRNPNSYEAYNNLGLICINTGRTPEAIDYLEQALKIRPGSAETESNLASALVTAGRTPEAVPHLREAVRLKPDYPALHLNLGIVLMMQNEIPGAVNEFKEAVKLKPDYTEAQEMLAKAQSLLNNVPAHPQTP